MGSKKCVLDKKFMYIYLKEGGGGGELLLSWQPVAKRICLIKHSLSRLRVNLFVGGFHISSIWI